MKEQLEAGKKLSDFLEKEQRAADQRLKKFRKKGFKVIVFVVPICFIVLFIVGLVVTKDMAASLVYIKYGAIFAAILDAVYVLIFFGINTSKRYMKSLKKQIRKQLPEGKEEFASQMMEDVESGAIKHIHYKNGREESVSVTRDYAMVRYSMERTAIVRLKDVERLKLKNSNSFFSANIGDKDVYINNTKFSISFYYSNFGEIKKKLFADCVFVFPNEEVRNTVLDAIRELSNIRGIE